MKKLNLFLMATCLLILSCAPDEPLTFWEKGPGDFAGKFICAKDSEIYSFDLNGKKILLEECQQHCDTYGECNLYNPTIQTKRHILYSRALYCSSQVDESQSGIYMVMVNGQEEKKILSGNFKAFDAAKDVLTFSVVSEQSLHVYSLNDQFQQEEHVQIQLPEKELSYSDFDLVSISPSGEKIAVFEIQTLSDGIQMMLHFYSYAYGEVTFTRSINVTGGYYDPDPDIHQYGLNHKYFIQPAWSHDSKKLAFVQNGDVFTVEHNGVSLWNRTRSSAIFEKNPAWSPVDPILAYVKGMAPPATIQLTNDATEYTTTLSLEPQINTIHQLEWSEDGQALAFAGSLSEIESHEFTGQFGNPGTFYSLEDLESGMFFMHTDGTGLTKISNEYLPIIEWVD